LSSDQNIIALLLSEKDSHRGFAMLTEQYSERLYWHVRKMVNDHDDTNDLIQDIFIKVWTKKDNFRGDSNLFTWMYRIATNETLNFLNKKSRKMSVSMDQDYEVSSGRDVHPTDGDTIALKLKMAINRLPDKQRLVFNMRYFDEIKFQEISEITGTSVGALKASYHIAVKKIEDILNED
jgi:RNA polymerase sigma factor (sigma-70 family)